MTEPSDPRDYTIKVGAEIPPAMLRDAPAAVDAILDAKIEDALRDGARSFRHLADTGAGVRRTTYQPPMAAPECGGTHRLAHEPSGLGVAYRTVTFYWEQS